MQKGTSNGIITDIDGNFTLNVPSNSTIVISFVGYKTQEIPVAGKTQINVTLKEDAEMLDEVVVVGYGQFKDKLPFTFVRKSWFLNKKMKMWGCSALYFRILRGLHLT